MQHILVASDLSERSDHAVTRALRLAEELNAEVTLLHVLESSPSIELLGQHWPDIQEPTGEREAAVGALKQSLTGEGEVSVVEGRPFVEIIRAARERNVDLIVLGAHGSHFWRNLLLGTTAERVVRKGDRPVLLIKHPAEGAYRRVLIPVDFSEGSRAAVELASKLAPNADLEVLHVYDDQFEGRMHRAGLTDKQIAEAHQYMVTECRLQLDEFLAGTVLHSKGHTKIRAGYPRTVITAEAESMGADLIVVGARGHGALYYSLLGSTATHVLREAPCDVLACRTEAPYLELP